ncbi:hypothetical protein [Erwinia phage Gungnir39]|nr:hypothetical protein [Erwinia phage Gungnir39]
MEWINIEESLPDPNEPVMVHDLNGEGDLLALRAECMSGGKPTGEWVWVFQIQEIEHEDVHIRHWFRYPKAPK